MTSNEVFWKFKNSLWKWASSFAFLLALKDHFLKRLQIFKRKLPFRSSFCIAAVRLIEKTATAEKARHWREDVNLSTARSCNGHGGTETPSLNFGPWGFWGMPTRRTCVIDYWWLETGFLCNYIFFVFLLTVLKIIILANYIAPNTISKFFVTYFYIFSTILHILNFLLFSQYIYLFINFFYLISIFFMKRFIFF